MLSPKLCLLLPHTPLAVAHAEKGLLVLWHNPNSLRHTGHLTFQLGGAWLELDNYSASLASRMHAENLRRDKAQRHCGAQDVTW